MNGQVSVEAANVVHSNATKRPVIFNNEVWCLWRIVQRLYCHGFVYSNRNPVGLEPVGFIRTSVCRTYPVASPTTLAIQVGIFRSWVRIYYIQLIHIKIINVLLN